MDWYDLMSSEHFHVILHPDKKHGIIFNRLDDTVTTINHDDAKELSNLKHVCRIYGIVGKYLNKFLVVIKSRALVGFLYDPKTKVEHPIFVITQVQVVDVSCISTTRTTSSTGDNNNGATKKSNTVSYNAAFAKNEPDLNDLGPFNHHHHHATSSSEEFSSLPVTINTSSYNRQRTAPWNPFKLANSFKPKMPTQFLKSSPVDSLFGGGTSGGGGGGGGNSGSGNGSPATGTTEDSDRRLVEEMLKLFNNTSSFFFSPSLDLTNRFSGRHQNQQEANNSMPMWRRADERFFWNKYMLKDLIELSDRDKDADFFIHVILQGFIAIENHTTVFKTSPNESSIELTNTSNRVNSNQCDTGDNNDGQQQLQSSYSTSNNYQLALISRRSVFHAGTRYRRRGCDDDGNCANFVETEQIFRYKQHFNSIIILRGSIPLYWYQTGYNYRPPPVLYRGDDDNCQVFEKHFQGLMRHYETDHVISIDCTEQTGREKILHDGYKNHLEKLQVKYPNLKHIEFDFHKHCRGRQCTDLQVEDNLRACGLTEQLIKDVKYYWNDGDIVWNQSGLFRVNCIDCTDRTNVVQRAIALRILDIQLSRLGVISPDTCQEENEFRKLMQVMWMANGNVLSTQYCGTRALFTGDRKLSGYIKDTYSSASRYYMSKFRDAYRQAAIDAMLGVETVVNPHIPAASRKDEFELMNLDPLLAGRSGGALLRDVGSRVTDRLARFKDKFYVKPSEMMDNMEMSRGPIDIAEPEFIEGRLDEALEGLNIDWPSTESVTNLEEQQQQQMTNIFKRLSHSDDSFQDDEFGQLMLSIDLAELQRLRADDEYQSTSCEGAIDNNNKDKTKQKSCEEINMTETCGIKATSSSASGESANNIKTSTTST